MKQRTHQPTFHRLLVALVVAGLAIGTASPALAQAVGADDTDAVVDPTAANIKARCIQAIDRRLDSLSSAGDRLDKSKFVTDEHHGSLNSIIDATSAGLKELRGEIDSSTEGGDMRRLCGLIGPEYRVYLVVLPQIQLTVAADRTAASGERAYKLEEHFEKAVEEAIAAGAAVTEAVRLADDAMSHLEAAIAGIEGVAELVLAVTPHGYDEGPGATTLTTARQTVRMSHDQLKLGWETARDAIEALKDAMAEI